MNMVFTCDREQAERLDRASGINKTGKYIGVITQAELAQSQSGAQYLEFAFKANKWVEKTDSGELSEGTGDQLGFIRMYITKTTGEPILNRSILDALMVVCKLDKCEGKPSKVFERDGSTRQGYRIPELEKQRVGLLLQRVNRTYIDSEGNEKNGYDIRIVTPFDPDTGKCASEILRGVETPSLVNSRLKNLHDRDANRGSATPTSTTATSAPANKKTSNDSFDALKEDVPF